MKNYLYSVFDAKLVVYSRPWPSLNDNAATREFMDAVQDGSNPNNQWHKHPEDFSLFRVGQFDDELGQLIPETPKSLITASGVIANTAQLDFFDKNGVHKKGSPTT